MFPGVDGLALQLLNFVFQFDVVALRCHLAANVTDFP